MENRVGLCALRRKTLRPCDSYAWHERPEVYGRSWSGPRCGGACSAFANANARFPGATAVFPRGAKILLVSPLHIGENAVSEGRFFNRAESLRFAALYGTAAQEAGVFFLDAACCAEPSPVEGTHLLPEGHAALARALAEKVRRIFPKWAHNPRKQAAGLVKNPGIVLY